MRAAETPKGTPAIRAKPEFSPRPVGLQSPEFLAVLKFLLVAVKRHLYEALHLFLQQGLANSRCSYTYLEW